MSKKAWIALCALAALLAACERRENAAETGEVSVETVPNNPAAPGDQSTTPGGTAGETAATPPGTEPDTTQPPDATVPPSESPSGGTPPANPPPPPGE
jgi:hypothetical protein